MSTRLAPCPSCARHVRVTEAFTIERYSHVMHIVSNVEGEIAEGLSALDALLAGFPHGTVTGAPKVRANLCLLCVLGGSTLSSPAASRLL